MNRAWTVLPCILLIGLAAAAPGPSAFVAREARTAGVVDADHLRLLRLADEEGLPSPDLPLFQLEGKDVLIETYVATSYSAGGAIVHDTTPGYTGGMKPVSTDKLGAVTLQVLAAETGFLAHLQSAGADLAGSAEDLTLESILDPVLDHHGFSWAVGLEQDRQPINGVQPAHAAGRHVFAVARGDATEVTVQGDFVLQVLGIDLKTKATNPRTFDSGTTVTPIVPGAAGVDPLSKQEHRVLRILVTGGTLTFEARGPTLQWAGGAVTVTDAPTVHLYDVVAGATTGPRLAFEGPLTLSAAPRGDDLAVEVEEQGPQGRSVQDVPRLSATAVTSLTSVAAVGSALAIALRRREPTMDQVERDLASGRHGRAARTARRILRRQPDKEDALLARSIALSKHGRHERAVRELNRFLKGREASDGTLHYVLGVALLETGREGAAQQAFEQAVRLTPALQAEVASRLGVAAPPSAPSGPSPASSTGYA